MIKNGVERSAFYRSGCMPSSVVEQHDQQAKRRIAYIAGGENFSLGQIYLAGVDASAKDYGLDLVCFTVHANIKNYPDGAEWTKLIQVLTKANFDGVIYWMPYFEEHIDSTEIDNFYRDIQAIPAVVLNKQIEGITSVLIDINESSCPSAVIKACYYNQAYKAVEILNSIINGKEVPYTTLINDYEVINKSYINLKKEKISTEDIQQLYRENDVENNGIMQLVAKAITVINSNLDVNNLLIAVEKEFKGLGIEGCYISIFDNMDIAADKAKLILAYNEERKLDMGEEGIWYPSNIFLPEGILPQNKRYSLKVEICSFESKHIGIVAFEMGRVDSVFYDILRTTLSSSIYAAISLKDREVILKDLEKKNMELEIATQEISKANIAKTVFLANMSHELRTPLNCIMGFAELLNEMNTTNEQKNICRLVMEETDKLTQLITQLIDISKMESGKLEMHSNAFSIYSMMEYIARCFRAEAQKKGLRFEIDVEEDVPDMMMGDEVRICQILKNLLANAIKFTQNGMITASIRIGKIDGNKVTILFIVGDTGIGIDKSKLNDIFNTFYQADGENTRKFGGTGLGTAISKRLVELMGGKIGVKSQIGVGSTFWFTLDFEIGNNTRGKDKEHIVTETYEASLPENKASIMVVEDYKPNQKVVLAYLGKFGCNVVVADNGREAVEKFEENKVNIILMDIQMPEMDGIEATKHIRDMENGREVTIIALTANAFESDFKKYSEVGMNDIITKPFKKSEFQEKISYWLTKC